MLCKRKGTELEVVTPLNTSCRVFPRLRVPQGLWGTHGKSRNKARGHMGAKLGLTGDPQPYLVPWHSPSAPGNPKPLNPSWGPPALTGPQEPPSCSFWDTGPPILSGTWAPYSSRDPIPTGSPVPPGAAVPAVPGEGAVPGPGRAEPRRAAGAAPRPHRATPGAASGHRHRHLPATPAAASGAPAPEPAPAPGPPSHAWAASGAPAPAPGPGLIKRSGLALPGHAWGRCEPDTGSGTGTSEPRVGLRAGHRPREPLPRRDSQPLLSPRCHPAQVSPWSDPARGDAGCHHRQHERLLAQAGLLRRGEAPAQEEEETDRPLHDRGAHELRAPDTHRLRGHGCGRGAAHDWCCAGDEVQGRPGATVEQLPSVVAYSWLFQPKLELPDPPRWRRSQPGVL